MRDTALLIADPMPLCDGSTAARTADVSGVTVIVIPNPKSTSAGSICHQKSK